MGVLSKFAKSFDEYDFPLLTRNGPYPRYFAPMNTVTFHIGMALLRERLEEADRMYDVDVIAALYLYRDAAAKAKALYFVRGYRRFVKRIQDSLWDCWQQLGMQAEMKYEDKLLRKLQKMAPRIEKLKQLN